MDIAGLLILSLMRKLWGCNFSVAKCLCVKILRDKSADCLTLPVAKLEKNLLGSGLRQKPFHDRSVRIRTFESDQENCRSDSTICSRSHRHERWVKAATQVLKNVWTDQIIFVCLG